MSASACFRSPPGLEIGAILGFQTLYEYSPTTLEHARYPSGIFCSEFEPMYLRRDSLTFGYDEWCSRFIGVFSVRLSWSGQNEDIILWRLWEDFGEFVKALHKRITAIMPLWLELLHLGVFHSFFPNIKLRNLSADQRVVAFGSVANR